MFEGLCVGGTLFGGLLFFSFENKSFEIARAYGAEGIRITAADDLLPALEAAIASGKPTVLDVPIINNPTPTTGHWNILDIYSPDKDVSHVST